jgi:hypothetical protein
MSPHQLLASRPQMLGTPEYHQDCRARPYPSLAHRSRPPISTRVGPQVPVQRRSQRHSRPCLDPSCPRELACSTLRVPHLGSQVSVLHWRSSYSSPRSLLPTRDSERSMPSHPRSAPRSSASRSVWHLAQSRSPTVTASLCSGSWALSSGRDGRPSLKIPWARRGGGCVTPRSFSLLDLPIDSGGGHLICLRASTAEWTCTGTSIVS